MNIEVTEEPIAALATPMIPASGGRARLERHALPSVDRSLLLTNGMKNLEKSTEEQNEKIDVIKGSEVLGYEGAGREEHSGQNSPEEPEKLTDELADNLPKDRR